MATPKSTAQLLTALRCARQTQLRFYRPQFVSIAATTRFYSQSPNDDVPPLLTALKGDLKAAIRAKDTERLSVLRSVMSHSTNASKTKNPIRNDVQLVSLLRQLVYNSRDAVGDYEKSERPAFVEKEKRQIQILEDYIAGSGVPQLREVQLRPIIQDAIEAILEEGEMKKDDLVPEIMKRISPGFRGKDVDKTMLAEQIEDMIGGTA